MNISSPPNDKITLTNYKTILPPDKKDLWNKYAIDPDRELLEWEHWVKIRNDEITIQSKNTTKLPPDLVMNLHENKREIQEWKTIIEHAQIQKKATLRGNTLWEQPYRLTQKCYEDQVYEVQRTAAERGRPHKIQHIAVPKEILETEKGVIGKSERKSEKKIDEDFRNYKKKREKELEENIQKINPYRSQLSELLVRGHHPKPPPPPPPSIPLISVTQYIHTQKFYTSYDALRINNSLFFTSRPDQDTENLNNIKLLKVCDSCTTWFYYFNTPTRRAANGTLFLENYGTVTIRYYWIKVKRVLPFIPEDSTEQVFFFNKNEDVLFPGQTKKISLTFLTEDPGIYSEVWELRISNIVFLNNPADKFLINLYGDATENTDQIVRSVLSMEHSIRTIKKRHFINGLINNLIDKITTIKPHTYPYKQMLLESEIFVMKNPICFYHQTEVGKLRTYFQEMKPGEVWDLSIVSWRSAMIDKGFEDRMKYYNLLQESHRDLLKPWYEDYDVQKQKHTAVKLLLDAFAKKMDDEYQRIYSISFPKQSTVSTKTSTRIFMETEMKNVFLMTVYEHLSDTIEACAGVISSLDLGRWIEFDFCQYYCPCQKY